MTKQKIILSLIALIGFTIAPSVFASEVTGSINTGLNSSGVQGVVNNCTILDVEHGAVSAYPSCAIVCNTGYTLSGSTCVLSNSVQTCNPASVTNGSVAAYPSCAIICSSGYTLSGTTCVAINNGGGGGSGGGGGGGGGGTAGSSSPTSTVGGDFNGDGKVNMVDMNTLMLNWGGSGPIGDLNNDGKVDILDFNMLMINWTV